MSGTPKPSNKEEIIPLDSDPEPIIVVPGSGYKIPVYYEDPDDFTTFGEDRGYSSDDSADSSSSSSTNS